MMSVYKKGHVFTWLDYLVWKNVVTLLGRKEELQLPFSLLPETPVTDAPLLLTPAWRHSHMYTNFVDFW